MTQNFVPHFVYFITKVTKNENIKFFVKLFILVSFSRYFTANNATHDITVHNDLSKSIIDFKSGQNIPHTKSKPNSSYVPIVYIHIDAL